MLTAFSRIRNANGIRGKGKAITSTFGSALSAARRGLSGGIKGDKFGQNFSNSYSAAMNQMKREQGRANEGIGKMGVRIARMQKQLGMSTKGERATQTSENIKKIQEKYDEMKNAIIGSDKHTKEINKRLETIKRSAPTVDKFTDAAGNFNADDYQKAVEQYNELVKNLEDSVDANVRRIASGDRKVISSDGTVDIATTNAIKQLAEQMKSISSNANISAHKIDSDFAKDTIDISDVVKNYKSSKGASTQFSASDKVNHAQDVDRYAENDKK